MPKTSRGGVQVSNLTWTPFASAEPLLRDVSFAIRPGERVLLVGPSGSGKSTLLRALAGVLTDTESGDLVGTIELEAPGLLLQDPNDSLVSDSVFREVAFGLENNGISAEEMPEISANELEAVHLRQPLDHPSHELSGGEMQRMAFAGVLAMRPQVLLLDEPTSMLDSESAAAVRRAVQQQIEQTGATVIVVEHEFADWLPIVERILVLNQKGELVFDGEPEQVLNQNRDELQSMGLWLPDLAVPKISQSDSKPVGRITVLTGPSGAGKTTELKRRAKEAAASGKHRVGYLPQQAELTFLGDSVIRSTRLTTELGLDHLVGRNPYEISGGEQRRLALAEALDDAQEEVFLDEPTVGQDRGAWSQVIEVITSARNGGVQLTIATHDQRLIAIADEVIQIEPSVAQTNLQPATQVSALAILLAPILLLLASMRVTSIPSGLAVVSALAGAAFVLGLAGFRLKPLKALIPGLIAVLSIGLSNWYLSVDQQPETGLIAALRVASFVLPGIALATQLRPIAMGDQLAQWLRLPARPVIAAVVAMQRLWVLLATWDDLRFIYSLRRAGALRGPIGRFSELSRLVFGLLVQAIRSAGTTSVAMEARGFSKSSMRNRTWAVKPRWKRLDWLVVVLAAAASAAPFLVF